ncbi:hypothetical protein [Burkholderia sp. TSV86]|nr:hypothetical protein [Burkholderia sp. TSV86]
MNEQVKIVEEDAKLLEAEQISEEEVTFSLSQILSNKEWQE